MIDDLAKALAQPMPRRKALRVLAVGVATVAVPGITPRRARASGASSGKINAPCSQGGTFCGYPDGGGYNIGCCLGAKGDTRTVCCPGQSGVVGSLCCPTGFTCGNTSADYTQGCICHGRIDNRTGECNCPPTKVCGNICCADNEKCEDGECVNCPDDDTCGKECCSNGTVCQNKNTGLCCVKAWNPCGKGRPGGVSKCCPPNDTCCLNRRTNAVKCCGPGVECGDDGNCKCTKDETKCGDDCCRKGEVCSKGLCCPKGLVNCDGKCCKAHLCVASAGKKVCCPIERIGTPNGIPVCCPPGTKLQDDTCCAPNNPNCCDSGDVTTVCGRGRICVNDKCH